MLRSLDLLVSLFLGTCPYRPQDARTSWQDLKCSGWTATTPDQKTVQLWPKIPKNKFISALQGRIFLFFPKYEHVSAQMDASTLIVLGSLSCAPLYRRTLWLYYLRMPQHPLGFFCKNHMILTCISNFQQNQILQFHALLLQISNFGSKTENIFWQITALVHQQSKSSARNNNLPHCCFP